MISKIHIKYIQSLHSKKNREQENLFIAEGIKVVSEFIRNPTFMIKELLALPDFIQEHQYLLTTHNIPHTVITADELQKISLQTTPNKVLAIVNKKNNVLDLELLNKSLTLYLDDIRDPGNLGTIIRIADWFGIKQIICSETTAELYNPKTIQATMGAILRVNVIYSSLGNILLSAKKLPIYGAVLNGNAIYTETLTRGIIVIGNEANGITEKNLTYISHPITIPAANNNGSESLNAANACAIICSEFHRQLFLS